jgi:hypothetical protein
MNNLYLLNKCMMYENIYRLIISYTQINSYDPHYSYITKHKTFIPEISSNENFLYLLEANIHKVKISKLAKNSAADYILLNNDRLNEFYLDFSNLSSNTSPLVLEYLEKHIHRIDWNNLSKNPADRAIDILEKYPEFIKYTYLIRNTNPRAIKLLMSKKFFLNDYYWHWISQNSAAIDILKNNISNINFSTLSLNESNEAIKIFIDNPDYKSEINWYNLSSNSCDLACDLLIENISHVLNISSIFLNSNDKIVDILLSEENKEIMKISSNSNIIYNKNKKMYNYNKLLDNADLCINNIAGLFDNPNIIILKNIF